LISLAMGVVLLAAFVQVQRTGSHPLLPLRIVRDRNRAGAYLAVGLTFAAAFGLFLFLTYFLQEVRTFSPVKTGLAFLPLPACIVLSSTTSNIRLLPRFGARRLIVGGLLVSCLGMLWLTQLTPGSSYAAHVLPSLVLLGLGFGAIVAPSMNTATQGVDFKDAGVASAMVNTMQQVGGSIGTALLSTFAAHATTSYLRSHHGTAAPHDLANSAATHGYTVAFAISAGIFLLAAVICGSLIRPQPPARLSTPSVSEPEPQPAAGHV
jgi:predicted MFS family arabinose efflux permease